MKNKKTHIEEKGVTIVALVVTIIVLLILAGISLSAIKGDGLLFKAKDATKTYKASELNEEIQRIKGLARIKGNNSVRYKDLKEELDKVYGENGYDITPKEDANSWNVTIGGETITINGGIEEIELTPDNAYMIGYTKNTLNQIDIPEEFEYEGKKYRVVSIGKNLFSSDSSLLRVTVPDSVVTIKDSFLANSGSIQKVYIGKGVTSIEGHSTLINAWDLKEIEVSSDNQAFKSIDGVLFTKNGNSLIYYPPDKPGDSYTVPDGVKTINGSAFSVTGLLRHISLPDSLEYIGYNAFSWSGIESIIIPNSVRFIGGFCFDCDNLETVVLPNSITEIKSYTFRGARKIRNMTIPASVRKISTYAFDGCSSLNLTFENYSNINELEDYSLANTIVNNTSAKNYLLSINQNAFSSNSHGSGSIMSHRYEEITDY